MVDVREQKTEKSAGKLFAEVSFLISVHSLSQLPEPLYPEVAFAGRSNVGKSSLINTLVRRKSLVKTSGKPGKTQGLNFFTATESLYLVDLPGYGFARVSKKMQASWQQLISDYLEMRESLRLVVVIIDLRHALKEMDRNLMDWLSNQGIPMLPVYTKADKLSKNNQSKHACILDAALGISADKRLIFSSKTGAGRDELEQRLASLCELC
jgi:GTP-binding protein